MRGETAYWQVLGHEVCTSLWVLNAKHSDHLEDLIHTLGEVGVAVQDN